MRRITTITFRIEYGQIVSAAESWPDSDGRDSAGTRTLTDPRDIERAVTLITNTPVGKTG